MSVFTADDRTREAGRQRNIFAESAQRALGQRDTASYLRGGLDRLLPRRETADGDAIDEYRRRFPQFASKLSRTEIADIIKFDKRFPMGQIGPVKESFAESLLRSPIRFASGVQTSYLGFSSQISNAYAALADILDQPGLAVEFRRTADKIEEFNLRTKLGAISEADPGVAVTAGKLFGSVAPSILSLAATGGASGPILAFYGVQAFGGGTRDYHDAMLAKGITPDAIDQFAIGMGYAVVEILAERTGLEIIGRKVGPAVAKAAGDAFLRGKPIKAVGVLVQAELLTDVEGAEEALTEFVQNVIAGKGIPFVVEGFDASRRPTDNLLRAFLMGKAGGAFLVGPAAIGKLGKAGETVSAAEIQTLREALLQSRVPQEEQVEPPEPQVPEALPTIQRVPPEASKRLVEQLSEQERVVAEEAVSEVLRDEKSTPQERQKAAEIVEALDESEPAEVTAEEPLQERFNQNLREGLIESLIDLREGPLGRITNAATPEEFAIALAAIEDFVNRKTSTGLRGKALRQLAVSTAVGFDALEPLREAASKMLPSDAPVSRSLRTAIDTALNKVMKSIGAETIDTSKMSADQLQDEIADLLPDQTIDFAFHLGEAAKGLSPANQRLIRFVLDTMFGEGAGHSLFDIGPAPTIVEEKRFVTAKPTRAELDAFQKRLGIDVAGRSKRKPTVAEMDALKASIRAQQRIARILIPQIRAEAQAAAKEERGIDEISRRRLRRLVRSVVPAKEQGTFLRLVESTTPGNFDTALDRVELAVADAELAGASDAFQKLQRRTKKAKIRENVRAQAQKLLDRAKSIGLTKQGRPKPLRGIKNVRERTDATEQTARTIDDLVTEAGEIVAEAEAEGRVLLEGKLQERQVLVDRIVANIDAGEAGGLTEDVHTSIIELLKTTIGDVRNISRAVENKKDDSAVLEQLLWRNLTRTHDKYLLQVAQRMLQLETAAKASGFASLADALAKLSGHGGKALTQTVEVEIDGKSTKIAMGRAMWFAAIDGETEALLIAGAPVQLAEGRRQKGVTVTEDEIAAIRAKLAPELVAFVARAKAIANQDTDAVFEVIFRLKGREPTRVADYFRRRRNIRFTTRAGLPEGFRGVLKRYLENLGFTREREGGVDQPIVVEDFLTALIDSINQTAKVQHVAESVRDAAGVLLHPEVQTAINRSAGTFVGDQLERHLAAASLHDETPNDFAAKVVRFFNANLAVAKLGGNPSSILRQIGGIPRLQPIIGTEVLLDGIAGLANVSLADMVKHSGFFWDRYVANITGRFSPVEAPTTFGRDQTGLFAAMESATMNFVAGDVKAAYFALRDAGMSSLQIINFFDSINARIAWAGYKAKIDRDQPGWSETRKLEWVAEKSADAIRETQNSSSVLDLSTVAIKARGSLWSLWLLFSSDRMKTANRIRRALAVGPARAAHVIAAESLNIMWSVGVGRGVTFITAIMMALAFGDEDDREEAVERAIALDRNAWLVANEYVSLIDPLFTPPLLDMVQFNNANIFDTALGSSLNDLAKAIIKMGESSGTLAEGDAEKAVKEFLRASLDAGLEVGALSGLNPLDAMMRRVLSQVDRMIEEDPDRLEGLFAP